MGGISKKEDEIDFKELIETIGHIDPSEHRKKEMKIIKDDEQFRISVPKSFAEIMKIDASKDSFVFHLVPDPISNNKFSLNAIFMRGIK